MKRMHVLLIIALSLCLVVAGGVIARASIPGPTGTINGCYKNGGTSHALTVVDSAGSCPTGYTALNWSQGPGGPVSGYEITSGTSGVLNGPSDTQAGAIAICSAGKTVISGGYSVNDGGVPGSVKVYNSFPNGNHWEVSASRDAVAGSWEVQANAICVNATN